MALLIDGLHIGEHCVVVALGIDTTGAKHALGLWDGSTENAALCQSLFADLQSRGLRTDRSLLTRISDLAVVLLVIRSVVTPLFPRVSPDEPRQHG